MLDLISRMFVAICVKDVKVLIVIIIRRRMREVGRWKDKIVRRELMRCRLLVHMG